jgi:hypothetical protein
MLPSVESKAAEYKAAIKNLNLPAPVMSTDPAMLRRRGSNGSNPNILTGWY